MAAAIPAAIMAVGGVGSSIAGGLLGRKASNAMTDAGRELTPQEKEAHAGGMGAAGSMGDMGSALYGRGIDNMDTSGNYFRTMMGRGGEAAMNAAVAPAARNIAGNYEGAARGMEARNVRGGVKDLAMANLQRDKSGAIAGLTQGVQTQIAQLLGNMGMGQANTGVGAMGGAASTYANLLRSGTQGRGLGLQGELAGNQVGASYGNNIGSLIFRMLSGMGGSGGGGYPTDVPVAPPGKYAPTAQPVGLSG